ncbi:GerAB/ArcD/ProY family transporter [Peribacillus frigoritolerans]|uniref:GerAB/ArcD/ProY family transporter n=1 Tax=Peribacillus frigoritolerans TaxID=450367 RepID=UPI00399F84C2
MEGERYNTKILSGNLILLEKVKISSGEFLILVIIFTIGGSILNVPALLVNLAKQDAWISYIITTLVSCPIP